MLPLSAKKIEQLFFVLGLCVLVSGCRLYHNAWRTTISEPIQYSRGAYDKWANRHFRGLAACALDEATSLARAELDNYNCEPFSADYQLGFIDGFVDFLEAGGTGNPPPMPPRRYWKPKYQNPAGYQCTQDWFLGFQHGTGAARASNYRSFVTVPLSDDLTVSTIPYTYGRIRATEHTEEIDRGGQIDERADRIARLPEITSQPNEELPTRGVPDANRKRAMSETGATSPSVRSPLFLLPPQ